MGRSQAPGLLPAAKSGSILAKCNLESFQSLGSKLFLLWATMGASDEDPVMSVIFLFS